MRPPLALRILPPVAYRAWFTPPPLSRRAAGRDAEAVAGLEPLSLPVGEGRTVAGFQVGEGPLALALHGWGGRPVQMSDVARRLAGEGMQVVAPELPGRAGGAPTDLKQIVAAVEELTSVLGRPQVVVGHSLGALALRLVSWDSIPPVVVLMAPGVKVSDSLGRFSERARLAPWVRSSLRSRLQDWDPGLFARIERTDPDQLPGADMLILHDPDDPDTSFASAAELSALRPATTLVPVPGTGHNGILHDTKALDAMVDFLAGRKADASSQLPA